jgi:ribosomal protein S4
MPEYKRIRRFNKPYIKHLREIMHFRVYYGDYSIIKFRRYLKRLNKRRIDFESRILFLLESRLDILLYRLNFFKHPRESRIFVLNKNILINSRLVSNLHYHLSIHEIVSVKKKYKRFFYQKILQKLKNEDIIFNNPKYIEISYRLLK